MNPPEQKVLVQHKVPRVLADLLKGQFHLMQEWLRPILEGSIDARHDLNRLQKQMDAMLATYREMEQSFASASQQPSKPES